MQSDLITALLFIKGHAKSNGLILVTNNTRGFSRADGLQN